MKASKKIGCAAVIALMGVGTQVHSGELIYRPINPSFGGDPFVGSYLLGKAQAQDKNTDPSARRAQPTSSTDRLLQSLESRLISQLISDVSRGEVSEGSFDSNEFGVVVSDSSGQLVVRVVDKVTGDITEISVGGLFNP
ncbi:curli assembly protein CsgF [Vreelandella zhaodongensis]|uniref:Curli production assembly/transport component CsgF n=1 Tax=Vreelandella zhaodongensis TaxID=1176240 RepID=A0ABX2ST07_VREZH|nr:curli assembly protein CsgF [Halomonas zhaodongensis]NYS44548.1 curli production assembly protein CsgF [Halomonas zhaodongensis]